MLHPTDITATFHASTIPNSRSLGVGQLNVCGIIISFTVYPSNYGQGFLISYPSKPAIKNGVQELDAKGKPKYFNEVYVADVNTRAMIEDAVLNAMQNRGVYIQQPQAQPQGQARPYNAPQQTYQQPYQQPQQQYINGQGVSNAANSFTPPSTANPVNVTPTVSLPGSSVIGADDLPF